MENFNHKLENLGWNDTLEIECDYCHNTFKRTKRFLSISEKRGSKLKFCNKKCFNDYFPAKLIKCICKECRQEFSRQPSELKRTKNYFCSSRCAGIFNNRERNKNKPKKVLIYISKKNRKTSWKKIYFY